MRTLPTQLIQQWPPRSHGPRSNQIAIVRSDGVFASRRSYDVRLPDSITVKMHWTMRPLFDGKIANPNSVFGASNHVRVISGAATDLSISLSQSVIGKQKQHRENDGRKCYRVQKPHPKVPL